MVECVDHSLHDLTGQDTVFGGITTLFGGDFRQTLPMIPYGSRPQIVSAALSHSNLWRRMHLHYLHQNMHLGQDPESDEWAAQLQHIGITEGVIQLPGHMNCDEDLDSLISSLY